MAKGKRAPLERLLQSAYDRQTALHTKSTIAQVPMAKTKSTGDRGISKFANHLRAIGFVSFVLAIGAAVMETAFWWFVGFTLLALAISIVDSLIEKSLGRLRYVLVVFFAVFSIIFIVNVVIGNTYPETSVLWTEGNYSGGADIDGLRWQDGWSDLTISIFNHGNSEIRDLDVTFLIGENVANTHLIGNLNCLVVRGGGIGEFSLTNNQNGSQQLMPTVGVIAPFHILCDRVPPNTAVPVRVALIHLRSMEEMMKGNSDSYIGAKRMPRWVTFDFSYKVGVRPYSWHSRITPTSH